MVISNISGQVILGPLLLTPNSIFEETQDLSCNPPAVQEMLKKVPLSSTFPKFAIVEY